MHPWCVHPLLSPDMGLAGLTLHDLRTGLPTFPAVLTTSFLLVHAWWVHFVLQQAI